MTRTNDTEAPYFSIVIPAHNEEDVIEKTCVSIIREFEVRGIDDIEIVVINDNSSDRTEEILRELSVRYSCLRLHQ